MTLSGLSWLLLFPVESMYHGGKFVDGDVSPSVRNGLESSGVTVGLQTDVGEVDRDTRGRVNVRGWCGVGGRGGAAVERTRGQTKEVGRVWERRASGEIDGYGNGNMFCTDGMATEQGDGSGQSSR